MMAGEGHWTLILIFWGLAIYGAIYLYRTRPIVGGGIILSLGAYVLAFAVTRPDDISTAIVFCRYAIIIFPLIMILPACSLERIIGVAAFLSAKGKNALFAVSALLLCGGLFVTGPLPRLYQGLEVTIGGTTQFTRECCRGEDTPDDIFSLVADKEKLAFRNMVDVSDLNNIHTSGADVLVLHKGMSPAWSSQPIAVTTNSVVELIAGQARARWGPPMFEDGQIVVFNLR